MSPSASASTSSLRSFSRAQRRAQFQKAAIIADVALVERQMIDRGYATDRGVLPPWRGRSALSDMGAATIAA